MNALSCHRNLTEDPHFETRVAKFVTLEVRHLEAQGPHQVVVEHGGGGGGDVWGYQGWEWSSFHTKNEFLLLVAILVSHSWFMVNVLRFILHLYCS